MKRSGDRGKPSSYQGEGEKKRQRNTEKVWLVTARRVTMMIEMKVAPEHKVRATPVPLKYTDYSIQHINGPLL